MTEINVEHCHKIKFKILCETVQGALDIVRDLCGSNTTVLLKVDVDKAEKYKQYTVFNIEIAICPTGV